MSGEGHKALVRRFYEELWNRGEERIADELFATDYVRHDLRPGNAPPGAEGQKTIARQFRAAFPDVRLEVDVVLADEQYVAARWTIRGTHRGVWGDIAPTGRRAEFCGVNIFRFAGDRVVELWNHRDDLGLMQQVGAPIYAGHPDKPIA